MLASARSRLRGRRLRSAILAALNVVAFNIVVGFGRDAAAQALDPRSIVTSSVAPQGTAEGVIDEIKFEGLRRVEAAAVQVVLTSRKGGPLRAASLSEDLRAIYAMGYFDDIKVYKEGVRAGRVRLIYVVVEKPSIRRVEFSGNDDISKEDIKEVIDLRPFAILSEAKVKRNTEKIKDLYNQKGFYLAEVTHRIESRPDNQVVVVFDIVENAKVQVRHIRFIGNRNLDESVLKSGMVTQEGSLISFLTGAGTYRKDAFDVDVLRISSQYFDHGYINVKVDTPDIEISPDRKYVYIAIRVEEGEQFSVGKIDFAGDLLDPKEKLKALTQITEGEIFNRSKLGQDLLALKTRYEDDGYAYANITPATSIHADTRIIDISFDLQKGQKVYYERINVVGNTKTRDKVVRRELKIFEGDLTSASLRELSRRRVTALGYFEKVEVKTRKGSREDLQIVDIEIKEKATGTFQIGAGFSSAENFIATAQVAQDNFLGRGQYVALSAQLSSLRQLFQLRFTEPYFYDSDWTFSVNAFNTETQYRSFLRSSTGGDVTFGHPITDDIRVFLTYTLEFVESRGAEGQPLAPLFAPLNNTGQISSLRATVSYDTRDNRLFPTEGMYHSASAETSGTWLGASENRQFQKYRFFSRFYYPLFLGIVAKLSARVGFLNAPNAAPLSPSEKFIMGGINTVRGYVPFSIGPERQAMHNDRGANLADPQSPSFVFLEGGNKELLANFELEFPIFEAVGIKGVLFLDAGNVYAEQENFFYVGGKMSDNGRLLSDPAFYDLTDLPLGLFWSVGFGFRWFSPIGPLRFEWGIPLTRRPTDEKGPLFEFSIGNAF